MRGLLLLAGLWAALADAQTAASGVHWRLAIDGIECEGARLTLAARIGYLGPEGLVEAPVARLVDGEGRAYPPKRLVWQRGSAPIAQWLSGGGVTRLPAGEVGEVAFTFEAAPAPLRLEFGDIPAFAVKGSAGCLKPAQLAAPRRARQPGKAFAAKVHRSAYPCREAGGALRTREADHPPHLPALLLLLGRGYLPATRQVDLPMGTALAQAYAYGGRDELDAIENAARRAVAADFPQYAPARHFLFNWGEHRLPGGNQVDSIGVYEIRPCK